MTPAPPDENARLLAWQEAGEPGIGETLHAAYVRASEVRDATLTALVALVKGGAS
jgi:hypothetical protein